MSSNFPNLQSQFLFARLRVTERLLYAVPLLDMEGQLQRWLEEDAALTELINGTVPLPEVCKEPQWCCQISYPRGLGVQ